MFSFQQISLLPGNIAESSVKIYHLAVFARNLNRNVDIRIVGAELLVLACLLNCSIFCVAEIRIIKLLETYNSS